MLSAKLFSLVRAKVGTWDQKKTQMGGYGDLGIKVIFCSGH